ncbi:CHAT domain-containing protein [bacterium]|nr:CHAT domain-containing protein [bacterium]
MRIEKARLLELLSQWSRAVQSPRPPSEEERQAGRQLYSLLITPLGRPDFDLWIMPSGELWDLPFETLIDPAGRYLVESSACAYLGPSEALQLVSDPAPASGDWVGAGNPRLPGTLEELAQIKRLFSGGEVVRDWPSLQSAATHARYLHLATHSQARPDRPLDSFLELAGEQISLEKIYTMNLYPGSLVVLSSCGGAVAQTHREPDLVSLSSGFRSCGAASVVAALWPVEDQATAKFFPSFYRELLAGRSRQQALRQAKLQMLSQPGLSHPYFWGAFTLLGDPR